MSLTPKQLAIEIIEGSFGDDLERTEKLFAHLTHAEMRAIHGNSGKTCQEVLDGYRKERAEIVAALEWVKKQPD